MHTNNISVRSDARILYTLPMQLQKLLCGIVIDRANLELPPEMLERIDFKTLAERRNESKLYLYKFVNNLVEINTDDILFPQPPIHNTREHQLRFLTPPTRINYHYSFSPSTMEQSSVICN